MPSAVSPGDVRAATSVDTLMAAVVCGDQAAFAALYDATADKVYGLVRTIVGDDARAEHITTEVYRRLWRTAARNDHATHGHARQWLLAMTRRQALRGVRTLGAAHWRVTRLWRSRRGTSASQLATETLHGLSSTPLRAAMDGLGDQARDVLLLIYYRGYTIRTLARTLGIPRATAHARLSTALRDLR
ncbi:MAG: sigma-70 family RNA polymerase sigma factor [Sciscionella sp.]